MVRAILGGAVALAALLLAAGPAPASPQGNVEAAQAAIRAGDYEAAARALSAAIADPDAGPKLTAQLYYMRGSAFQRLGRLRLAVRDFSRALIIGGLPPEILPVTHFARAFAYERLGERGLARRGYTDALAVKPDFAEALYRRGELLLQSGDLEPARADFEAALAAGHSQPHVAHYGLGRTHELSGRPAEAGAAYLNALAANPQFTPALERLIVPQLDAPGVAALEPAAPPPDAAPASPEDAAEAFETPLPRPKPEDPDAAAETGVSPPQQTAALVPDPGGPVDSAVQLGAFRSRSAALTGWQTLASRYPALLGALPHDIEEGLDAEGAAIFRLRAGPLARTAASDLCGQLKAAGAPCLVVAR